MGEFLSPSEPIVEIKWAKVEVPYVPEGENPGRQSIIERQSFMQCIEQ